MPYYVFYNINEGRLGERFFHQSPSFFVPDTCICYELKEVAALNAAERRKTVRAKRPANSDYAAALSTVARLAREIMDEESYKKYLSLTEALRASIAKRNCA